MRLQSPDALGRIVKHCSERHRVSIRSRTNSDETSVAQPMDAEQ